MNEGQTKFHDFILEGVLPGKEAEAEALLADGFAKQEAGEFNQAYLDEVIPKFVELMQPDKVDAFKLAAEHMHSTLAE